MNDFYVFLIKILNILSIEEYQKNLLNLNYGISSTYSLLDKLEIDFFSNSRLTLKISSDQNMVDWGLGRLCSWGFLINFFPLFERASRTFCEHLTYNIWSHNEYVVIALNLKELLSFC